MQKPASYDPTIYQGASFELEVEYADGDGVLVDMTGFDVDAQLWNRTGTERLATFDLEWQVQESGMFKLKLSDTVTSGITEQGRYDVLVTEPSGKKYYLLEGTAKWNTGLSYRP
jgi:hypothetical protein